MPSSTQTTTALLLLLAVLLPAGVTAAPLDKKGTQPGRGQHASWDDVNVVAHGLLQLGQGLKEHVEKTKLQMRDVNAKLKTLNGSLSSALLGLTQGRDPGQELKDRARAGELEAAFQALLEEDKAERQSLRSRMDRMEERFNSRGLREPWVEGNSSDNSREAAFIQRTLELQNRRIDDLVEKIQQQQDKLEKQVLHLQALQSKVGQRRAKIHRRSNEALEPRGDPEPNNRQAGAGLAKDCHDLFLKGQRASGVYTIQPENSNAFNVLCEMTSDGGWTVIQKRQDGSQNFNQLWADYQKGFGSLNGEFWLGLDNIHSLSNQGPYTLRVELSDWAGNDQLVNYQFQLDGPENNYALHLEQTSSPGVPVAMATGASGLPFSTSDRDSDFSADINCAKNLTGGWWFASCGEWNLNGRYPRRNITRPRPPRQQMSWATALGNNSPLKSTVLKISPLTIKQ